MKDPYDYFGGYKAHSPATIALWSISYNNQNPKIQLWTKQKF